LTSYRNALAKIEEPRADGKIPDFRSGFATAPLSLGQALAAMEDPRPQHWTLPREENIDEDWTQNCQGVARGGGHWFFSGNGSWFGFGDVTPRAIFKLKGPKLVGQLRVHDYEANHLGALDFHDGQVYAALEGSPKSPHGTALYLVDETLEFSQLVPLLGEDGGAPPQGGSMPWCAVHPWNGLVYSSPFGDSDDVTTVFAYEWADDGLRNVPSEGIPLRVPIRRVQGGCFSPNGHLYLTSDEYAVGKNKAVHVFSALNGAYRGFLRVLAEEESQELEGLCFAPMKIGGHAVQLHVVLLDQIDLEKDDIFFKHYAAPDPAHV
jgi:hypothetical protein